MKEQLSQQEASIELLSCDNSRRIRATFRHLIHRQLHDGSLTITDNQRKVLYGWHPPKDGIFNLRPLLRLPASHYER